MKFFALVFLMLGGLSSALADQCALNSRSMAQSARALIIKFDAVYEYCQPCRDQRPRKVVIGTDDAPTRDKKAIHFRARPATDAQNSDHRRATDWELVANEATPEEADFDLAYAYVKTGTNTLSNVSKLVGCPTRGVSTFIDLRGVEQNGQAPELTADELESLGESAPERSGAL